MTPTLIVGDMTGIESSDSFDVRPCVGGTDLAAGGAGTFNEIQILNPARSGILVIPELVLAGSATAQLLQVRTHDTALATALAATALSFRDRRIAGEPVAELRTAAPAVIDGTLIINFNVAAGVAQNVPMDFILLPGMGLLLNAGSSNTTLTGTWYWREITSARTGTR